MCSKIAAVAIAQQKPVNAADWHPIFEKALQAYVLEQEGGITEINCRNLLKFISTHEGYPDIDAEEEARHVTKLLNGYFRRFFGPMWDGVKYRDNRSKGRSLLVGTDNLLDLIRYNRAVK
ncbi:MAG: hypothetical protein OK436_01630 [Thaumarchaeota archaeon]|nr:hypothetical protein [Nitrososphaerota archaeon]